jgi:hypothetical protein
MIADVLLEIRGLSDDNIKPKNLTLHRKGAKNAKFRKENQILALFFCDLCTFAPLR